MAPALKHNDVLQKICGLCYRKIKKLGNITEATLKLIIKHHHTDYNLLSGIMQLLFVLPVRNY